MHKYHFHRAVFAVYALAGALAVLFLSAGVKSVTGQLARFPDHYLFNLVGAIVLSWVCTGPREVVVLRKIIRFTRRMAATAYSYTGRFLISVRRAASGRPPFFPSRPQTEP
jgi:uncharacterized membrane protein YbhN (UPF0104 family)